MWQKTTSASSRMQTKRSEYQPLLDRDLEKGNNIEEERAWVNNGDTDDVLTVAISPSPDHWDQKYTRRHELLYRNWASMELDAPLYPSLSTTPLPIRLLFKLPRLLFPAVFRDWLIGYFLSIQLLVLYSAFDHHPYHGSLPFMTAYALWYFPRYWMPFAPRIPEWVCRCQWTSMPFLSHWKVWLWSGVGKKLLGMSEVYEEYTPERLKDCLDPMPGELHKTDGVSKPDAFTRF